ncbi:uncharacterized protein LOC117114092 isoform X2 [Anneissia japonica]|nr:uncharacterized protein LOC117114092 isoform X2 [Anneissia japonica]XP_033113526.1 uncharacterized protein LOC117114092 isoform X2 [Anneissia japonica]
MHGLTKSDSTKMVISGNVSPRTSSKFDPLRRGFLRPPSRVRERPPKSNNFSIDKTRAGGAWESRKTNTVLSRPSVEKYFPHLAEFNELYKENETQSIQDDLSITDYSSWWEASSFHSQNPSRPPTPQNSIAYPRSTTAPPRLNQSFVSEIEENIDLTAIDLVSIANEQEYQAISNERHRAVHKTMRCHSAKTMYPDTPANQISRNRNGPFLNSVVKRRKPCVRATSSAVTSERVSNKINALSMEWCDVLGPKHCYHCNKVHKREHYGAWNESNYKNIAINAENLSTLTLVERLMPHMDVRDIQSSIADGNISRCDLRRKTLIDRRKGENTEEQATPKPRRKISAFGVPDGLGFFLNFSDLRSQMLTEDKKKKTCKGVNFDVSEYLTIPNADVDIEVVGSKEKHYANYFSPPLLSRSDSKPSFYAGGSSSYKLPKTAGTHSLRQRATNAMAEMEASSVVKFGGVGNDENDSDEQS